MHAKLLSDFEVTLKWLKESSIWSSEPSDDLDFDKVQAISDFVATLGANYKKNLTQLNAEMLIEMPEFLANVPDA